MRILLVEDDEAMAGVVADLLVKQHYAVDVAKDGEAGWELIQVYIYELIVLDVVLPKLDGMTLCRRIRSHGYQMPVLLLTARQTSMDKVSGLDVGADDYVVKPFDLKELSARIRALLRRGNSAIAPVLQWGNLQLDPSIREVTYENRTLYLSPKEYVLLELFLRNNHRVFSRSAILDRLWSSEDAPGEDTVKAHIKGLRQKLKSVGAPVDTIETVYGMGYRLKLLSDGETKQNTPIIIAVGLVDELTLWLEGRLSLPIKSIDSIEKTLDELDRGNWSLLVIDVSAIDRTVAKLLEEAYSRLKEGKQSVIYCLENSLSNNLPKKLIGQILYHPLNREELAGAVAETLGLTLSIDRQLLTSSEQVIDKSAQRASLQSAVSEVWEKFKDKIIGSMAVVEEAIAALVAGTLDDRSRQEAAREAHKLAGSLGSFGFAEGSRLARETEEFLTSKFGQSSSPNSQEAMRLLERIIVLRRELLQ